MCLSKSYSQLTPRIINTIQGYMRLKDRKFWTSNDSKINLLLEIIKKDLLKETYGKRKCLGEVDSRQ